jgi:hypothetical protein
MQLNEVLKVADSFAYLQMSNYIQNLSSQWFWTGWFGFLYSLPIAWINFFVDNNFLSAKILNIILFNFSWFLLYKIAKKYLIQKYLIILIVLFFLSPILLHFNIAILSENIYLPLFLLSVLWLQNFLVEPKIRDSIAFGFLIVLMYLTRWEAFIYLCSVWLVSIFLLFRKKVSYDLMSNWFNFKSFLGFNILLLLSFSIFVFPYIYHLHTITWEWWLSNKWSSNLRQAILRGKEKMDDKGFEKAVAEMTPDSKHLISGFAGGLKYDKPTTWITLKKYILEDKSRFLNNWWNNQVKLYSNNLPNIIAWNARTLYSNENSQFFYKNKIFLISLIVLFSLFFVWLINLYRNKKRDILIILFSFFFIASIFFTLFFTLDRYFIIFIPLFLIIITYWIQTIDTIFSFTWTWFTKKTLDQNKISWHKILKIFLILNFIWIYSLGLLSYYNSNKENDNFYSIKKEAWEWLKGNNKYTNENSPIMPFMKGNKYNLNILERFPIVTYYSWTNNRFITPYTDSLDKLLIYAKSNKIDYLIVDSLDFYTYRKDLQYLLDNKKEFRWLVKVKVFEEEDSWEIQRVIIYGIKK